MTRQFAFFDGLFQGLFDLADEAAEALKLKSEESPA